MAKPVLVVGSINMDLVARTPHIPAPGETLTGTDFATTPGGKGANQAVAAARLGYSTQIIGAVGEDIFGEALLRNLAQAGVDTAAVAHIPGPSGVAQIQVADDGQSSIVVVPGANGLLTSAILHQNREKIRGAGVVLCQLEIPLETVSALAELCAEAGVPLILDPAPAVPLPEGILQKIAWFTPNETEAALYTGANLPAEDAAKLLLGKGLQGVILKRGSHGSYLATAGGKAAWIAAFPVTAIDTVAVGDCFNGAFAVALLEGNTPAVATSFASAAAAISVTRRGAQASMPTREEVEAFLAGR